MKVLLLTICLFAFNKGFSQNKDLKPYYQAGKWGFIHKKTGKVALSPVYDSVHAFPDFMNYLYTPVKIRGKWGFIDGQGIRVTPFSYQEIFFPEQTSFVAIKSSSNRWGTLNAQCLVEIIPQLERIYFSDFKQNPVARTQKGQHWGLINRQGANILPPEQREIIVQKTGLLTDEHHHIWIKHNDLISFLDTTGKGVGDSYSLVFAQEKFYKVYAEKKWGLINKQKQVVVNCQYDSLKIADNHWLIYQDNKVGLINYLGENIIPVHYSQIIKTENPSWAIVKKNGKYGFVHLQSKKIIDCQYDAIEQNFMNGKALVRSEGKTFLIDEQGGQVAKKKTKKKRR